MAKYVFVFVEDHTVEVPAARLETRLYSGGPVESSIEVPATTFFYPVGKKVSFNKKSDALAFQQKMGQKVRPE